MCERWAHWGLQCLRWPVGCVGMCVGCVGMYVGCVEVRPERIEVLLHEILGVRQSAMRCDVLRHLSGCVLNEASRRGCRARLQ